MEQKKYMDIERLKDKYVDGFQPGDYVVVQEKIDGANFSIRYDSESGVVKAFSRKKILDLGDNLRGAWGWSQRLNENFNCYTHLFSVFHSSLCNIVYTGEYTHNCLQRYDLRP